MKERNEQEMNSGRREAYEPTLHSCVRSVRLHSPSLTHYIPFVWVSFSTLSHNTLRTPTERRRWGRWNETVEWSERTTRLTHTFVPRVPLNKIREYGEEVDVEESETDTRNRTNAGLVPPTVVLWCYSVLSFAYARLHSNTTWTQCTDQWTKF